jgi:hypothetical protein
VNSRSGVGFPGVEDCDSARGFRRFFDITFVLERMAWGKILLGGEVLLLEEDPPIVMGRNYRLG